MEKIAHGITGNKLKFVGECYSNVSFMGKTLKLKGFVMNRTQNLFGMDWIESSVIVLPLILTAWKNFKKLMIKFPEIFFSEGLEKRTKSKATLKIKENVTPIFRLERKVPFAAEASISKELDHLDQIGMLTKTDYSELTSPTVYVKKKNNKIRTCADFSTRLNDCLEIYNTLCQIWKTYL